MGIFRAKTGEQQGFTGEKGPVFRPKSALGPTGQKKSPTGKQNQGV
jgi:hypothetical protein